MASDEITTPLQISPLPLEHRIETLNAEMNELREKAELLTRESQLLLRNLDKQEHQSAQADVPAN